MKIYAKTSCQIGNLTVIYLIYNAPLKYADLILNGVTETYLKAVTEYTPLE